jgi:putative ABC transport system permease protein
VSPIRRWAPAVRMARREAWRAKGRSILVLTMIALPVLAVTAADVVIATSEVKGGEAVERRIGGADALVRVDRGVTNVVQLPDPDEASGWNSRRRASFRTLDDVSEALGRDVEGVEIVRGGRQVRTDAGATYAELVETDLTSPLATGTFRVAEGRVPEAVGEVAVNGDLAARGPYAVGDDLDFADGSTLTVVGIVENAMVRGSAIAVAPPGGFELETAPGQHSWLVDAGGPVTWADVQALNAIGATVWSRSVLTDPPPDSEISSELGYATSTDDAWLAVVGLVVVMALLEVVLLAGPAFAVIARRLQRSLALMAANGATPPQARKVVLASALVLGGAGAAVGVGLGLVVAWAALPVVQRFSDSYLGPYDVPWLHLLGIAGFGLLSALLAAVVPAWLASRQDVVAVLAGRRGDRKPSLRSPLLGVMLLGVGAALAAYGAARQGGEYVIAVSAIVAVLGMILLIPVVVVVLARLARRLPLPLRFAVRDAARHRTRTVPAVAAVAATVAGVVALGIGNASDAEESRATYTPMLAMGLASVSPPEGVDVARVEEVLDRYVPDATVTEVWGPPNSVRRYTWVDARVAGTESVLSGWSGTLSGFPVSRDGTVPAHLTTMTDDERTAAEDVLAQGGALVFTDQGIRADEVRLVAHVDGRRGPPDVTRATVPAVFVETTQLEARAQGVLSQEAAAALGLTPVVDGLVVGGAEITESQEQDVNEALLALDAEASMYVERGYQNDDETVIIQLVLGALAAVLMLGGTLTATFLSLSDARPDLATLSAVGASPRSRRAVAASYALVIALVGAVLGVAVGLIPGIAVTYPLTGASWVQEMDPSLPSHFLAVPWLLIGSLVIALPVVTALLVALFTRSRLPMVARID